MPSPLLHLAAGTSIGLLDQSAIDRYRWRFVALVVLAGVLPDLDVVPGLLIGDPNRYHGGVSHSIGFAVIAGLLAAGIVRTLRWRVMLFVFLSWATHGVLDSLTFDARPPYGVPLLWPLSTAGFYASPPFFSAFRHGEEGASVGEFFADVFSTDNLQVMLTEAKTGLFLILGGAVIGWLTVRVAKHFAGHSDPQR